MRVFRQTRDFKKTEKFFRKISKGDFFQALDAFGRKGVEALASATPVNSGKTADSWDYEIHRSNGRISIYWTNSNVNDGVNIALILQYGHGTRNGGYVQGRDYINPAIRPIFDKIADDAWREITRS